jgi:hypothetical protein
MSKAVRKYTVPMMGQIYRCFTAWQFTDYGQVSQHEGYLRPRECLRQIKAEGVSTMTSVNSD